jgi:hypothetical protein
LSLVAWPNPPEIPSCRVIAQFVPEFFSGQHGRYVA